MSPWHKDVRKIAPKRQSFRVLLYFKINQHQPDDGNQKNLVIDVLYNLIGFYPDGGSKDRLAEHGGHGHSHEGRAYSALPELFLWRCVLVRSCFFTRDTSYDTKIWKGGGSEGRLQKIA